MAMNPIVKPLNNAKKKFVKWLEKRNAESISFYNGTAEDWDYYCVVDGFINNELYSVCFHSIFGKSKIDYSDEYHYYKDMSIDEFLKLIS